MIKSLDIRRNDFLGTGGKYFESDYGPIYDSLEGRLAYAKNANTYKLRKRIMEKIEEKFSHEISTKEINRARKHSKRINIDGLNSGLALP